MKHGFHQLLRLFWFVELSLYNILWQLTNHNSVFYYNWPITAYRKFNRPITVYYSIQKPITAQYLILYHSQWQRDMVSREVMSWTTSPTPEHTTVTTRWLCSPRYVSWPAPDIVIMIIPGCCYDVRVKIRHRGGGQRHRLLQNRLQWSRRIISETNAPRSVSQVSLTLIIKYFIRDW